MNQAKPRDQSRIDCVRLRAKALACAKSLDSLRVYQADHMTPIVQIGGKGLTPAATGLKTRVNVLGLAVANPVRQLIESLGIVGKRFHSLFGAALQQGSMKTGLRDVDPQNNAIHERLLLSNADAIADHAD